MIPDSEIEAVAVSSATPQQAADNLVASALTAGGLDNVTVVVADVLDDGSAELGRKKLMRRVGIVCGALAAVAVIAVLAVVVFIRSEWYLGDNNGTVGIYQGVNASFLGIEMSSLVEESAVAVSDLPSSVQDQLASGIRVQNEETGRETLNAYRTQIDAEKSAAASVAAEAQSEGDPGAPVDATGNGPASGSSGTGSSTTDDTTTGSKTGGE